MLRAGTPPDGVPVGITTLGGVTKTGERFGRTRAKSLNTSFWFSG